MEDAGAATLLQNREVQISRNDTTVFHVDLDSTRFLVLLQLVQVSEKSSALFLILGVYWRGIHSSLIVMEL